VLYELVRLTKGKETVMMVDTKAKVDAQKGKFKTSQKGRLRGNRVEYVVRESAKEESFKRQPRSNWNSYPG
jgi:hypothetical protein